VTKFIGMVADIVAGSVFQEAESHGTQEGTDITETCCRGRGAIASWSGTYSSCWAEISSYRWSWQGCMIVSMKRRWILD
jgi:hypothetical protein